MHSKYNVRIIKVLMLKNYFKFSRWLGIIITQPPMFSLYYVEVQIFEKINWLRYACKFELPTWI